MAVNLESVSPPRRLWRLSEGGDLATTATIILLPFLLTRKKKLHEGLEDPAGGGTLRPFSNRELLVFLLSSPPLRKRASVGPTTERLMTSFVRFRIGVERREEQERGWASR